MKVGNFQPILLGILSLIFTPPGLLSLRVHGKTVGFLSVQTGAAPAEP